jgi:acyl-CoA thioesterase-1
MGLPDPATQSWAGQLQYLADSAGIPARVVNAGVSGDTSAGGLRRLDWLLRERVDVLVVELGANDGLRGQDPEAMAANLRAIVERTLERYPEARVALVQMEAPPNLGAVYVDGFRQVFGEVADATGATLLPFILEEVAGRPELNQEDGIHPTPAGHAIMARAAWPELLPLIQSAVSSP